MALTRLEIAKRLTVLPGIIDTQALALVNEVFGVVAEHLDRGGDMEIRGIGSLCWVARKPRVGRNPKTGERVDVPARQQLRFKPGKNLGPRPVGSEKVSQ